MIWQNSITYRHYADVSNKTQRRGKQTTERVKSMTAVEWMLEGAGVSTRKGEGNTVRRGAKCKLPENWNKNTNEKSTGIWERDKTFLCFSPNENDEWDIKFLKISRFVHGNVIIQWTLNLSYVPPIVILRHITGTFWSWILLSYPHSAVSIRCRSSVLWRSDAKFQIIRLIHHFQVTTKQNGHTIILGTPFESCGVCSGMWRWVSRGNNSPGSEKSQ